LEREENDADGRNKDVSPEDRARVAEFQSIRARVEDGIHGYVGAIDQFAVRAAETAPWQTGVWRTRHDSNV
jgi:hypothetical protein